MILMEDRTIDRIKGGGGRKEAGSGNERGVEEGDFSCFYGGVVWRYRRTWGKKLQKKRHGKPVNKRDGGSFPGGQHRCVGDGEGREVQHTKKVGSVVPEIDVSTRPKKVNSLKPEEREGPGTKIVSKESFNPARSSLFRGGGRSRRRIWGPAKRAGGVKRGQLEAHRLFPGKKTFTEGEGEGNWEAGLPPRRFERNS